ncbi:MAG: hypothetical protein QXJ32_03250 [Thermoplasmata archaeon]
MASGGRGRIILSFREYLRSMFRRHGSLVVLQSLVAIANTLSNTFALIYLLREGHDYIGCTAFILICCAVPLVLIAFASKKLVENFSASIVTGLFCLVIYYISLMLLDDLDVFGGWLLVLVPATVFGTYIVTFWIPYNALIMHVSSRKSRGATIGLYFLVWPLIATLGPLAGGAIITVASYDAVFSASIFIVLCAMVFISGFRVLRTFRERIIIPELLQSVTRGITGRQPTALDFTGVGRGIMYGILAHGVADGVFWVAVPVLSFEYAATESTLSQYLSLFALWGAAMTVVLGYVSDRIMRRSLFLRIGALMTAVSMLAVAMAGSVEAYLAAMSSAYFWVAVIPAFLFTMLLDKLERFKRKGVVVREFVLNLGRVLGVAMTLIILLMGMDMVLSVAVAGLVVGTIAVVK